MTAPGLDRQAKGLRVSGLKSLTFAGATTPAAQAEPDAETARIVEELGQQVDQLRKALVVATDDYQVSEPLSFGGTTGSYELISEFNTPCQYRVVCVTFTGAATATVSTDRSFPDPVTTGVIQPNQRQQGIVCAASAATTVNPMIEWSDLRAAGSLYLQVTGTADSAFAVVQFRRRVSRAGVYAEGHA